MRGSGAVFSTSDGAEEKRSKLLNCVTGRFESEQRFSDFGGQYQETLENINKSAVLLIFD